MTPKKILDIKKMFCGCGNPDLAWLAIKNYLRQREDFHSNKISYEETEKLETGKDYILAYLLDYFGLTEHGGSVGGCWLTNDGKEILNYLEMLFDSTNDVDKEIEEELS